MVRRGPLSGESAPLMAQLDGEDINVFPPMVLGDLLRRWRLPTPALLVRMARRPWAFRPTVAALTLLPSGRIDVAARAQVLQAVTGDTWPDGLWICAARRDDGGRVVFGRRGAPRTTVADAVAASCAIPGYFSPVRIRGIEYFDGGVHSPTNADVLRHAELDLVIAISPMSAAHGRSLTVDAPLRWTAHRRLEQEIRRLQAAGTTVVRFEPGPRCLAAMGLNAMALNRSDKVVQQAFLETGRRASRGHVADRLSALAVREPGRPASEGVEGAGGTFAS